MKKLENAYLSEMSVESMLSVDGGNVCGPMGPITKYAPRAKESAWTFAGFVSALFGF